MQTAASSNPTYPESIFFLELHQRLKPLPVKSDTGNECISIEMDDCIADFQKRTEEFLLENADCLKLIMKGREYYVEVVDFHNLETKYAGLH